jgi:peptidoglycan/LPS O-acetylase OafA/YrhL
MGGAARVLRMALTVGLVQSWAYPLGGVWWNGPAWSVSVEAVFYLLFPALALALARVPRRRLPLCAAACTLLVLGPPLLYMVLHPDGRGAAMFWMPRAPWQVLVRFNAFARLPEFCMGLCLGRLFLAERTRRQTPSGRASWPWTGALASCGALAATYLLLGLPWPYVLLHDGALDALFGLLIYGLATARGPLARILATPAVVLLGEASYATYLLHYPLWHIVMRAVPIPAQAAAKAVYMAAYLLLLGALSVLSLRLIEEPARRAIRHRWSGGRR